MYKIDRIGNHQLVDLSSPRPEFGPLGANFPTVCNARGLLVDNVITNNAAVGDEFAMSVIKDQSETWTFTLGDNFSFGRFITGTPQTDNDDEKMFIGVGGSIVLNLTANAAVDVSLCVGRLQNGSPVVDIATANANPVDNNYMVLARDRHEDAGVLRADVEATLVDGLFNGAVSEHEQNPIAIYWKVDAYAAVSITGMHANLWAWSYRNPMDVFDPLR